MVVAGPTLEIAPFFHQINHNKPGIALDLKDPRAIEVLKSLAEKCDVVIENMTAGAIERAGPGWEVLRKINPRLVMLSMSGAGQFGPQSAMRSYAPLMASYSGLDALVGYRGESPIGCVACGLGDPNASAHGLLAGLARRNATGEGCFIDLAQTDLQVLEGERRAHVCSASGSAGHRCVPSSCAASAKWLPDLVRLESAARPHDGRDHDSVLHVAPVSHQRVPGKTTLRKRWGSARRRRSAKPGIECGRYRRNFRSRLLLHCYFRNNLILRGRRLPLRSEPLQQVLGEQHGAKDQGIHHPFAEVRHDCPRYFLALATESSPVLAISSRIVVSACKFFMR